MPQEVWRNIPGFSKYQVSSQGRLRRARNLFGWGRKLHRKGTLVKVYWTGHNNQYAQVLLVGDDGGQHRLYVSHVMLEAFRGPRPTNHIVKFKNGNRKHLRLSNLEYQYKTPRLTAEQVKEVRKKAEEADTMIELSQELNISYDALKRAVLEQTYKWVQ